MPRISERIYDNFNMREKFAEMQKITFAYKNRK